MNTKNELLCVLDGEDKPYGVTNSCDDCEFNMSRDSFSSVGDGQHSSLGDVRYCEKGYWKEDI